MKRSSIRNRTGLALATLLGFAGCFTEVGNPGTPSKQSDVTAQFHIDYHSDSLASSGGQAHLVLDSGLVIEQFYFNVVEANYTDLEDQNGRIWKYPDSLGFAVDFTGKDTSAVLPPVSVPPGEWHLLKVESQIPLHDTLRLDTLDWKAFAHRGYIKGVLPPSLGGHAFLCQLPPVKRVNLVYDADLLAQWRVGDAYHIDVVFFASRWLRSAKVDGGAVETDKMGREVLLFDLEHNRNLYDTLRTAFFKSFNSLKVWKEGSTIP